MTIQELTNKEFELLEKVNNANGYAENQISELNEKNVFNEYDEIFKEYVKLSSTNLEALKRGLFLFFIHLHEPSFNTGIHHLNNKSINDLFNNLKNWIDSGNSDYELGWFLTYYLNWDMFNEKLKQIFPTMKINFEISSHDKIDESNMVKRGQMGFYFNSLNKK